MPKIEDRRQQIGKIIDGKMIGNHIQAVARPLGNRGAGVLRDKLPKGSSAGVTGWKNQ